MNDKNPQVVTQHHTQLHCPHCGQATVVQHGNIYTCLNCNFRRNVSEPDESVGIMGILFLLAVILVILTGATPMEVEAQPTGTPTNPAGTPVLDNPLG